MTYIRKIFLTCNEIDKNEYSTIINYNCGLRLHNVNSTEIHVVS